MKTLGDSGNFHRELRRHVAETVGVSLEILQQPYTSPSISYARIAMWQSQDRLHRYRKAVEPIVNRVFVVAARDALFPYCKPRSGDMQTMCDDIDRVEMTPATRLSKSLAHLTRTISEDLRRESNRRFMECVR